MKRNVLFVVGVVLIITGLLLFGKRLSRPGATGGNVVAAKGAAAPDFNLKTLDGNTLRLSSLHGKAVMVNFWATWCDPCKVEMPWLVDLQKKYGPEGLQIVGVAVDDSGEKTIADFSKKMGVNYPILIGTEKVADMYGGVDGLPTSFFVDRSGKIVDQTVGLVSESILEDNIRKALGPAASATQAALAK